MQRAGADAPLSRSKVFAMLLLALNPEAAFNPSSPHVRASLVNSAVTKSDALVWSTRNVIGHRAPVSLMSAGQPAVAERWYVDVPRSIEDMAKQASRAIREALPHHGRLLIEGAAPELDATSDQYSSMKLTGFAGDIALYLFNETLSRLPEHRNRIKVLFPASPDALMGGAAIHQESTRVGVLGSATAVESQDAAFIVVTPTIPETGKSDMDCEGALELLLRQAGIRPVILVNARMGNSPVLSTFQEVYMVRPLSIAYKSDQFSRQVDRVSACLLYCYPHEWNVLHDGETKDKSKRKWRFAGRFSERPKPKEIEGLLQADLQQLRDQRHWEERQKLEQKKKELRISELREEQKQ